MDAVIRTVGLRKSYGRTNALDGLDLEVGPGEIHGFLGPNGAGKSTTIRILLGLARATGGTATVFGADPWRDAARLHRRIAYVPGDVNLWPGLSGGEAIDLLARLRGGGRTVAYRGERARLLEAFELDPRKKGRSYSKGNRQKVALVAALSVPADLLVLDEPTSGLDPLMEVVFQREVRRARDRGAAVLLSSHILSEVEQVCDRVSIIRAGRIVDDGTLDDLRHLTRTQVSFADPGGDLPVLPGAHEVARRDGRVHFTVDTAEVASLLPALGAARVASLRIEPASLEELFLRHYGTQP
ncbi:MAG: ABC transporter ATP-binding protein [Microbacterium sp.]|jgi:ABC-2 type transport system ATP-binding protein|uniref:ABC transporter ATP-binding protein n=1 Tax=Microbacterium sp. TaxID=51671 RepID=UPI0025DDB053|nr:ABC transporter ATP-binding protein [Microbacterium sp.]MBQ9917621.1 ABC transporter ATP-binding protein [Microbacterium sp.]